MGDKILGSTLRSVGRFSKADDSDASWYTAASDAGAGGSFESNPNVDILRLTSDDLSLIKGRVIDVWSGFGSTYDNITNNMALYFLVFVFPVVLLFIISMIFVILNIRKLVISKKHPEANEKVMTEDEMKLSLEAERERMRQEILAELKKEQEQQANADNKEDKEEK
jgi:signal peptidase